MPYLLDRNTRENIFLDGGDLTGKDTVGDHVQSIYGLTRHRLVMRSDNPHEKALSTLTPDEHMFVSSLIARSIIYEIQHFELPEPTLLLSSHALRGAAVEAGLKKPLAPLFEDLSAYFPHLDAHIVLTADLETKRRRLAQRAQQSSFDKRVHTHPESVELMEATMVRLGIKHFGATIIDTSPLTIEQSKTAALQAIREALSPTAVKSVQPKPLAKDLKYFERELKNYEDFVRRRHKVEV